MREEEGPSGRPKGLVWLILHLQLHIFDLEQRRAADPGKRECYLTLFYKKTARGPEPRAEKFFPSI
jgi:hypothetical protein